MSEIKDSKEINVTDKPSELKSKDSEISEVNKCFDENYKKYIKDGKSTDFEYPKKELDVGSGDDSKKDFEKKGRDNDATWIEDYYNQRDNKHKVEEQNHDKLLHASNFDEARVKAFEKAGLTDPNKIEFGEEDVNGTGTVVEFRGEKGAKVIYDAPHPDKDSEHGHDKPHVGIQTAGKKSQGGRERVNITYEGPQHPHISHNNQKNL